MTLTPEQLVDLTGYVRHAEQARWMDQNGIGYRLDCNGHVKTTWTAINIALSGIGKPDHAEPNFDF